MGRSGTGALTVSAIPLHIQKRFEQRWASRFTHRLRQKAPKNVGTKATPSMGRRARQRSKKNPPVEMAGFSQFFRGKKLRDPRLPER